MCVEGPSATWDVKGATPLAKKAEAHISHVKGATPLAKKAETHISHGPPSPPFARSTVVGYYCMVASVVKWTSSI